MKRTERIPYYAIGAFVSWIAATIGVTFTDTINSSWFELFVNLFQNPILVAGIWILIVAVLEAFVFE